MSTAQGDQQIEQVHEAKKQFDQEGNELLPNGLRKDYNTMVNPGVPDGNDPNNPVRVYADGVFDMYHMGHARVLEQAKKLFKHTYLIVGVSGDEETIEKKGKIVMNEQEREDMIRHCKWVDETICPCPWVVTVDFLKEKNIHYVAHDDLPYGGAGQEDIYYEVKKAGMFRATQRTEGISTSDIILRIIKDYDMYIERSLKRGYKRHDIGISKTKELRVKFKSNLRDIKDQVKQQFKSTTPSGGEDGAQDGSITLKRQGSGVQSIMRVFQKLEYGTERLWLDFSRQYTRGGQEVLEENKQAIQDLKDKYLDDDQLQELEAEEAKAAKEKEEQPQPSLWQRAWKVIMENLELGQSDEAMDEEDDDVSIVLSDMENEDGVPLSKRERKLLAKRKQYSDVI